MEQYIENLKSADDAYMTGLNSGEYSSRILPPVFTGGQRNPNFAQFYHFRCSFPNGATEHKSKTFIDNYEV